MRTDARCRYRAGMVLLASVVCLFGCRHSGIKRPSFGLGQATVPPPAIQEEDSLDMITAEQKADVQMAVARSVEKHGHMEQAIRLYLEVVRKDGRRADAYHRLAVMHDKKGDWAASAEFYREALQRNPDNAEIHCDRGYSYYFQRRWKEAETSLHRALQLNPNLARAHNNLGLVLAHTDQNDAAMVEFLRAGCNEAEARGNLAFVLTSQRRQREAEQRSDLALASSAGVQAASSAPAMQRLPRTAPVDSERSFRTEATREETILTSHTVQSHVAPRTEPVEIQVAPLPPPTTSPRALSAIKPIKAPLTPISSHPN